MKDNLHYEIIDMKAEVEKLRVLKGNDGEPFEGEIPLHEVEQVIAKRINEATPNTRFIFDDFTHKNEDDFMAFAEKLLGVPNFVMFMTAKEDTIKARFMKKNEVEELSEEQVADLKADSDVNKARRLNMQKKLAKYADKCTQISQNTDITLENLKNQIKSKFSPGLLVVKHDTKIAVDSPCSNLSLKYNMLYLSAH